MRARAPRWYRDGAGVAPWPAKVREEAGQAQGRWGARCWWADLPLARRRYARMWWWSSASILSAVDDLSARVGWLAPAEQGTAGGRLAAAFAAALAAALTLGALTLCCARGRARAVRGVRAAAVSALVQVTLRGYLLLLFATAQVQMLNAPAASAGSVTALAQWPRRQVAGLMVAQLLVAFLGLLLDASPMLRVAFFGLTVTALGVDCIFVTALDGFIDCALRGLCPASADRVERSQDLLLLFMASAAADVWLLLVCGYVMLTRGFCRERYPYGTSPGKNFLRGLDTSE